MGASRLSPWIVAGAKVLWTWLVGNQRPIGDRQMVGIDMLLALEAQRGHTSPRTQQSVAQQIITVPHP